MKLKLYLKEFIKIDEKMKRIEFLKLLYYECYTSLK